MLWNTIVYGLINAAVMALVATGFNLTFGISGIANFAYGALYILTGFGAWILLNMLGLPSWAAAPLMVLITAVIGATLYRLVLIRLRGMAISEVIATFGIGLVIMEFFRYLGFTSFQYSLPVFVDGSVMIGDAYVDIQRLIILGAAAFTTLGLWVFTHHTRLGLGFRGMAQEERTALSLGIDSDVMATLAMGLGGGLCALAAVVILPIGTMTIDEGYDVLLQALAVCIVGGLGSSMGVVVASLILGLGQTFTSMYLGPHWMMIVILLAILAILILKPSGLFGKQQELGDRV